MIHRVFSIYAIIAILSVVSCKTDDSKTGNTGGGAGTGGSSDDGGSAGKGGQSTSGGSGGVGGATNEVLTWVDSTTKLTWAVYVKEDLSHSDATTYCENLELSGHEDWRLPTVDELRSIVSGCGATEPDGSCGVGEGCLDSSCRGDDCGGCEAIPDDCYIKSALKTSCGYAWSAATQTDYTDNAWGVGFNGAHVSTELKSNSGSARCVR